MFYCYHLSILELAGCCCMNLLAAASISEFRVQTIGTCWLLLHELQGDVLNYY